MTAFYVGQAVRIDCPNVTTHGQETTVTALGVTGYHFGRKFVGTEVDIRHPLYGNCIYEAHELIPLSPPKSIPEQILAMQDLPDYSIARISAEPVREGV